MNKFVGNENQLANARRISFRDGVANGVNAVELHNISGLYMTCIEDMALNIYDFSYKGINCAFQTKNGLVSNKYFGSSADEFCYYWAAGMLFTGGLANTGEPVRENGIFYPQHGRVGMLPAENVTIKRCDDEIILSGTVTDSVFCGHNMKLDREIIFPVSGKEIKIRDSVTNMEAIPSEMMILYHFNFGYPLLDEGARMVKGKGEISDNLGSGRYPENCGRITAPSDSKEEEVYCHTNTPDEDGFGCAAVINDKLGMGCFIKYKMDTLPLMMQWKNFCSHDYAMGLEPSNCYILGREAERKNGTLPVLAPYETKTFEVTLGILYGKSEIEEFEKKCR